MDRILIYLLFIFIIYYDIKKMYIPNILNILLFIFSILYKGFNPTIVEDSILGMGVYTLPLIFIYGYCSDLLKKEVVGFGDIKLILSLGYLFGYKNFYDIYIFYTLTYFLASIIGIILGIKRKKFNTYIPLAPFIILSFIIYWEIKL